MKSVVIGFKILIVANTNLTDSDLMWFRLICKQYDVYSLTV